MLQLQKAQAAHANILKLEDAGFNFDDVCDALEAHIDEFDIMHNSNAAALYSKMLSNAELNASEYELLALVFDTFEY